MKVLVNLLEDEKKKIQNLFERSKSLNSLVGTLADAELNLDEQNWLYEKLINDTTETQLKFHQWWISSCEKYNLDKKDISKYYVDFADNTIILIED